MSQLISGKHSTHMPEIVGQSKTIDLLLEQLWKRLDACIEENDMVALISILNMIENIAITPVYPQSERRSKEFRA